MRGIAKVALGLGLGFAAATGVAVHEGRVIDHDRQDIMLVSEQLRLANELSHHQWEALHDGGVYRSVTRPHAEVKNESPWREQMVSTLGDGFDASFARASNTADRYDKVQAASGDYAKAIAQGDKQIIQKSAAALTQAVQTMDMQ